MKKLWIMVKEVYGDAIHVAVVLMIFSTTACAQKQDYLQRSVYSITPVEMEISTETAHYKPMFGAGDKNADVTKGVNRYGKLIIDSKGKSKRVDYGREELVYYVLSGSGTLQYGDQEVPISGGDFFYIPINMEHCFLNPREDDLKLIVMGYDVPKNVEDKSKSELQLSSADDVAFQVLSEGHGPSSHYRLLLGTTRSTRDRLAAANQILSMYVIDFDHGGTNNAHSHENAEEIYFMLQGEGEMIAGQTAKGEERRFSVEAGDSFYFSRNSLVGFYSGTEKGEDHARILAVRSKYPGDMDSSK